MMAMPVFAEHVDLETARKVATIFLNNNGAKVAQLTDLTKSAGFPNLYIFTAEQGFVVMSADDCVKPILGYSLTGTFVAEGMPENLRWWLQGYNDHIQDAVYSKVKATPDIAKQWNDLTAGKGNALVADVVVEPMTQTKWDQPYPYNMYCPGGSVTGCVATAMAQVMKYWNYPAQGIGSHDYNYGTYGVISANFGNTQYDWTNMPNTYSSSSTETQKNAVATLMYHCGVSVEMLYAHNKSGSTIQRSSYSLKTYFNYSASYIEKKSFNDTKWIDTLKYELNNSRPMLYGGSGTGGGHAFVCDGYNSDNYFHFNWGWSGSSNGYFTVTLGEQCHNYPNEQNAVIGIAPLTSNTLPLVLSINQIEQEIALTWTDSQNCSSYNVYRNNALISTTTETTFTDSHPTYGSNVYYIRGLSGENLTLPSNSETATLDYPIPAANHLTANADGDNLSLSWNASDWCLPSQSDEASFSYADEIRSSELDIWYPWGEGEFTLSWGHRYPAEALTTYSGKVIHEVSFFSMEPGAFDVVIYQGTTNNHPVEEIARESITTARIGWSHVRFNTPVILDSSNDLWIFIINTDQKVHTVFCKNSSNNTNGRYFSGSDPTRACSNAIAENIAWFIHAYLTDGTYTYNLYQDGTKIAENLAESSCNATLSDNAADLFTVKTNYYGGESDASNKIGFAKGTASVSSLELAVDDKITLTKNSTLTVSGILSNTYSDNLILENGAQLIHNSANVKATVKKDIAAYEGDGGWYFIASPVSETIIPSADNSFLTNLYDLYYYDEPTHYWKNYKANTFNLNFKQGYLYANNTTTTLQFAGTLSPSNTPITLNNLSHEASELNGFNLVGNPFACNATIDQDCYIIDNTEGKVVLAEQPPIIAPCEGVFVKATTNDFSVTFSKSAGAKANGNKNSLDLVVTQDKATLDRARVRLGEGINMEKITLNDNKSTQITLWHDGQNCAVAYTKGLNELPLNFKAAENGTYSIGIEANCLDWDYLHLIDNLTGNDIDLLVTPYYSFEAKTTDYVSRFILLLAPNCEDADGDSETSFAYVNNGNIIITGVGDTPNASLQVVDLMGRVICCRDSVHTVSTNGMTPGIYVLRLNDCEKVRTQKIVIE